MTIPIGQKSHLLEHMGIIPQTFFLTITNPGAVLGMAAMIGGLGSLIGGLNTYLEALLLVAAVMGGSLLWWLGLSELIATIRHKLTEERLKLINRIAGGVLSPSACFCCSTVSCGDRWGLKRAACASA